MNYISWFCTLFVISSYLRHYPGKKDKDTKYWGKLSLLSYSVSILSILLISKFQIYSGRNYSFDLNYFFVSDSNAILALTNAITSFMFFKNLNIGHIKLINIIASSAFGVLLLHANSSTMRLWLWNDTINCTGHYDTPYYWLYAIGCIFIIYIVCTIIDQIRLRTIETPLLNLTESICKNIWHRFLK